MLEQDRRGAQVIDGDVEKALDLSGVEIDGQDAIGTRGGDEVGHQLGGDGGAALVFAVLAGVAEVRDHRGDALGAGAFETVDVDQQLHEVGVDRVVGGLDDEAVSAAHVFLDLDQQFAVGKNLGLALAHGQVEMPTHGLGQGTAGAARKILMWSRSA